MGNFNMPLITHEKRFVGAVYQGVNLPSSAEEGWMRGQEMPRSILDPRRRGGVAKRFVSVDHTTPARQPVGCRTTPPLLRRGVRFLQLLVVFLILQSSAFAQTTPAAKQILDSMMTALGGKQFLDVKEIQTTGRFFMFKRDTVSASDIYADYLKFPDMDRVEFGREKQKTIQINRGLEGWIVSPPQSGKGDPEVEEQSATQTEDFLKNFKTTFDYVARFVVNNPRTSVLSTGAESVDGKRADVLEVRDSDKNLMRIFVDRESRLPVKMQTRMSNDSVLHEEIYANWHRFDGVLTPLMVVRYKGGVKTMEIRAEKVAYNPGFADSLFAPPAPKSK
jgi:outer membrane lipoprotein-sorting protein